MAFQLSYKPQTGKEPEFIQLIRDGYFESHTTTDPQATLESLSIHPLETINVPCVGFSETGNQWAEELLEQIKRGEFLLDYTVYFTIINSLPDFWSLSGTTLFSYCANRTAGEFKKYLSGFYVTDLIPKSAAIPNYNQLGNGEFSEWLFDMFIYHEDSQEEIFRTNHFDAVREMIDKEFLSPADSVAIADTLLGAIRNGPNKGQQVFVNLYSMKGMFDLMPHDVVVHKVASFANWLKFWGERGHYFTVTGKSLKLGTFKLSRIK